MEYIVSIIKRPRPLSIKNMDISILICSNKTMHGHSLVILKENFFQLVVLRRKQLAPLNLFAHTNTFRY